LSSIEGGAKLCSGVNLEFSYLEPQFQQIECHTGIPHVDVSILESAIYA